MIQTTRYPTNKKFHHRCSQIHYLYGHVIFNPLATKPCAKYSTVSVTSTESSDQAATSIECISRDNAKSIHRDFYTHRINPFIWHSFSVIRMCSFFPKKCSR
eukprot:436256_1